MKTTKSLEAVCQSLFGPTGEEETATVWRGLASSQTTEDFLREKQLHSDQMNQIMVRSTEA